MATEAPPGRADPLAGLVDLSDFQPATQPKPRPAPELVRSVSESSGFPSRAAAAKPASVPTPVAAPVAAQQPKARAQRRMRTGRNVQVNMKVTAATVERLNEITDAQGWVYGETLEHALEALAAALAAKVSSR